MQKKRGILDLEKIRKIYKAYGLHGVYQKLKRKVYKKSFEYSLSLEDLEMREEKSLFSFHDMNGDMLDEMYQTYTDEISERKYNLIRSRLAPESKDRCYIVKDENNEICGYYHIAFGNNYDTGVHVAIIDLPDNVYLFDDYTFRRKRGIGAHKFSIRERLRIAAYSGYKISTVHIESVNNVSSRSYESTGFKKVRVYRFNRLMNKTTVRKL